MTCPIGTRRGYFGTCVGCDPGYYNSEIVTSLQPTECTACSSGSYSAAGAGLCTQCEPGLFQPELGQSFCHTCREGHHCPLGSSVETQCEIGFFSAAGAKLCTQCEAGSYADSKGMSACVPCAAGSYQDETAGASCKDSPAGMCCLS